MVCYTKGSLRGMGVARRDKYVGRFDVAFLYVLMFVLR